MTFLRHTPLFVLFLLFFWGCGEDNDNNSVDSGINGDSDSNGSVSITIDKARYNPGEEVTFKADRNMNGEVWVRYRHLAETIEEKPFEGERWSWTLPNDDFKGYLVDVYEIIDGREVVYGSVAVDVSSDWTVFPRYGFLTEFSSEVTSEQIENRLAFLNRCHINAIQFYDWHNKHHWPLKMNGESPADSWLNIAKREVAFNTVKTYIDKAKYLNIASMQYNLLYGAWENFENDGVSSQWMLFNDQNHQDINKHDLDDNWALSDIYLANPANMNWQNFIFDKTGQIYDFLDFDGWHIDQLGDRGTLYDFDGNSVDLTVGFRSFLNNLRKRFPDKKMVLNAVDQYGQEEILEAPTDFAYTEIWSFKTFDAMAQVIRNNYNMGGAAKKSVLAAYINYGMSNSSGYFNTPAVLLADAVIFAFGGAHLELGEHMLANEYFPNDNLFMRADLKEKIVNYYDFLVAYQNLLRDGGEFNNPVVTSLDGQRTIQNWPPNAGDIAIVGKLVNQKQVLHLINFTNATSLLWRDDSGTQQYPDQIQNLKIMVQTDKEVNKVWFASPDSHSGVSQTLDFVQTDNTITLTIPDMQYWGMLVIE